jgi:hypothetical protein
MEELIKQAFLHVDVIGPHVHEGHYDLVGPDGEIILPQVWETMVQPDWTITMHMWPMPEPPPLPPPPPKDAIPPPPDHAKMRSKSKSKKRESQHVVVPPHLAAPSPLPPPPSHAMPMAMPADAAMPAGVVNVTPGASSQTSRSRQPKVSANPFMRWAAGTTSSRTQSVKKPKKTGGAT